MYMCTTLPARAYCHVLLFTLRRGNNLVRLSLFLPCTSAASAPLRCAQRCVVILHSSLALLNCGPSRTAHLVAGTQLLLLLISGHRIYPARRPVVCVDSRRSVRVNAAPRGPRACCPSQHWITL